MIHDQNSNEPFQKATAMSDKELFIAFPEGKKIIPSLIKELCKTKDDLLDRIIEQNATINRASDDDNYRYFWKSWYLTPLRDDLKAVEQKLTRLRRQLRLIKGVPIPSGAINNDQIQAAKAVPIESIFSHTLRKTGNMLTGLCPFSAERTPSFFIYKNTNRCWCFGCQQGGNTIDTYMKLHDCDFKTAVLALVENDYGRYR